jgi:hypothetical protein
MPAVVSEERCVVNGEIRFDEDLMLLLREKL